MAAASTEHFTDPDGNRWKFVWVHHEGGLRLFLTTPTFEEHELRAVPSTLPDSPRPQRDADVALPLDLS